MTVKKSEAAELLAFAAAFDQRTIGHADVEAWAVALADIPWDGTARQAIADHYSAPGGHPATGERRFIQPHNVRVGRSRIRNDRLARIVEPPPNPVEGVRSYEEVRALRRAIADGEIADQAAADRYLAWGGSLHLLHQQNGQITPGDGPKEIA